MIWAVHPWEILWSRIGFISLNTADLPEQARWCISVIKCGAKNRNHDLIIEILNGRGIISLIKVSQRKREQQVNFNQHFMSTGLLIDQSMRTGFIGPSMRRSQLWQPHLLRMSMLLLCVPSAVLLNLQSLRVSPTIHSDHFITKECFIVVILVLLCLCITQYKNLIYRLVTEGGQDGTSCFSTGIIYQPRRRRNSTWTWSGLWD